MRRPGSQSVVFFMLILKLSLILILASKSPAIFEKEQKVHKMLDLLLTEIAYIFKLTIQTFLAPFTSIGLHRTLLCPSDIINPWRVAGGVPPPEVQEIPKTDLRTLAEARLFMIAKQTKMREILWEDTKTELERYKHRNLRLGRNKSRPLIAAG